MKVGFVYRHKQVNSRLTVLEVDHRGFSIVSTQIAAMTPKGLKTFYNLDILASFRNLIEQHRDKI